MVARRKPSNGSGKNYFHFAIITLVGAGLVALASLETTPAVKSVAANPKPAPFKASLTTKEPARQFDMAAGPASPPGDSAGAPAMVEAAPFSTAVAAPARRNAPPPGDPAKLIGVQHPAASTSTVAQPTAEQAAQLIADSRAR